MDPYRESDRHRPRRVRERDYRDALDAQPCDFAHALDLFERLPYREWRVPGYHHPVMVLRRCTIIDAALSLYPGEFRLGPWRILLHDRTVGLAFDHLITLSPDLSQADRTLLVHAGALDW